MSGETASPVIVQELAGTCGKSAPCDGNVAVNESSSGKILIEVNLSKQNMQETKIQQIIKELFELNSQDVEVEKVVMPIGQDTWQIRKANLDKIIEPKPDPGKKVKHNQQSRMKLINHKKIYKLAPQTLSKIRNNLRKKVTERNLAEQASSGKVSDVHSSPAVTNLLSKLYPNPYNLITLMDVQDKPDSVNSLETSDCFTVTFKSNNLSITESVTEQDVIANDVLMKAVKSENVAARPKSKKSVKSNDEHEHKVEKSAPHKVKRMVIPSDDTIKRGESQLGHKNITKKSDNRANKTDQKSPRRNKPTIDVEKTAQTFTKKEKDTHPTTSTKKNPDIIDKSTTPVKKIEDREPNTKKKSVIEKNKCVMQYLKLIKDIYEAEEKDLQDKIDHAWKHVFDISKSTKKVVNAKGVRQNHTTLSKIPDRTGRHRLTEATKTIKPTSPNFKSRAHNQIRDLTIPVVPLSPILTRPLKQPPCLVPPNTRHSLEPSHLHENHFNWNPSRKITPSRSSSCHQKDLVRANPYMMKQNQRSTDPNTLPIEILNRNAYETDKKIDLLIRHIDNSMNKLTQSEKSNSCNLIPFPSKADLAHQLQKNLGYKSDLFPLREEKAYLHMPMSKTNSLLINQSYHSLHIIPIENGIRSVKISTDTLFKNQMIAGRNRDCLWWQTNTIRSTSVGNIENNQAIVRNANFVRPSMSGLNPNTSVEQGSSQTEDSREIVEMPRRRATVESEVPEIPLASQPLVISVESSNELGSYAEIDNRPLPQTSNDSLRLRKKRDTSRISFTDVKTFLDAEEVLLRRSRLGLDAPETPPSSLSYNIIQLEDRSNQSKPIVVQEITWNYKVPVPMPVVHVQYRYERNLVFEKMEAQVFHVAVPTYFSTLAIMSVAKTAEQDLRQHSSEVISLHNSPSLTNDRSESACKFIVLPTAEGVTQPSSTHVAFEDDPNDLKVLKSADLKCKAKDDGKWDSLPSGSSTEMCIAEKQTMDKIKELLRRETNMQNTRNNYSENLSWMNPIPDPYESNAQDDDTDTGEGLKKVTPGDEKWGSIVPNRWDCKKLDVNSIAPHIFKYLSSDASNTSVDDMKIRDVIKSYKNACRQSKTNASERKKIKEFISEDENCKADLDKRSIGQLQKESEDEEDSCSSSSFKSSNNCSDFSDVKEHNKRKSKSRSHFLDRLFHELRYFRKCLQKRKQQKRKDERKDAKDLIESVESRSLVKESNAKVVGSFVDEFCIDELTLEDSNQGSPRNIFKTSFRGKESVTELMIDLKDVRISDVRDISVEKRKLATDHTKISIIISKQGSRGDGVQNQLDRNGKDMLSSSSEGSYHSLYDSDGNRCDENSESDDYTSVKSSTSEENNLERDFADLEQDTQRRKHSPYRFDYYKRMDSKNSYDSLNVDKEIFISGKYEKELAPLQKALTDMQFRIRNIQRNAFCTSDEYYERALKLAKMSAGYCQSCKSKTVIPEDPLGIYQRFIPRSWMRSPHMRQKEYYFRTTSSTNSSFYSIQSSNSDNSDRLCRYNTTSSLFSNNVHRNKSALMKDRPIFLSGTINF